MITTEQAIKTLKENCCAMCAYGSQDMDSCDIHGCDNRDAIKAMEQGDVLDKIRADIEQEITYKPMEMWDYRMGLTKALEIIDKYKAESEEEE